MYKNFNSQYVFIGILVILIIFVGFSKTENFYKTKKPKKNNNNNDDDYDDISASQQAASQQAYLQSLYPPTKMAESDCSTCNELSNVVNSGLTCTGLKETEICNPGFGGDCGTYNECNYIDTCVGGFDYTFFPFGKTWNSCKYKRQQPQCITKGKYCDCSNKTKIPVAVTKICNQKCPDEYELINETTTCKKKNIDKPINIPFLNSLFK